MNNYKFNIKNFGFVRDCKATYLDEKGVRRRYKWYETWIGMINRCYNIHRKEYKYYGAKKVYISDEFKVASVFRDWYLENNPNGNLVMDKDIICEEKGIYPKYYGKDTITFVSISDNSKEMMKRNLSDEEWCKKFFKNIKNNVKKGKDNYNSKPMKYYETKGTRRGHFKTACKRQGWNFDDFIEVDSGERYVERRGTHIKYYYIYKYKQEQ